MRYNVLKSCAALSCRACVDETTCVAEQYLTLRTGCERYGRKNPLPYSFSQRSHIGNLRRIRKQGKGRSSKRKGNRRCPFLFAPAAGAARSRRPQTANPPLNFSEKLSARKGRTRSRSSCAPLSRCRKGAALSGRTRLRQFAHPGFPVQKRSRPVRANTLAQFVCPGQPVQKTSLVFKLNCFSDNATAKRHTQAETA